MSYDITIAHAHISVSGAIYSAALVYCMRLCVFLCCIDCKMTPFPVFSQRLALPCGYTCSDRPQVIATFVRVRLKV